MAERPSPRQSEAKRGKAPVLKINHAKVIGESRVRANQQKIQYDDCACSLI
jgi:hypothetical protein